MRVRIAPDPDDAAELAEFPEFCSKLARVAFHGGDGAAAQAEVEFPNFTLLRGNEGYGPGDDPEPEDDRRLRTVNALIDAVYPGVGDENLPDQYFVDRAILAPTNASVWRINEMVAERLSGGTKEYLSNDSLEGPGHESLFEPEFLNSLNFSAFAMTINKAQGQSIHHVGIYLESPVFAHGQLYVALSRVTSRKAIKIAVDPETVDEDGS
ncbi:Helitron helicase, partial [Phytophthora megakarya]